MYRNTARRLVADTTGAAAILLALSMPVLVGGFGLGTEVGLWYFNQRKLQNAADMAAYAAATELRAGRTDERIEAAALEAAVGSGYESVRGSIEVITPYNGDPNRVEVRVGEDVPRMFTALFSGGDINMGGRAVAEVTGGIPSCVLGLSTEASKYAVKFSGSSSTTVRGCNVHANSYIEVAIADAGQAEATPECASSVMEPVVNGSSQIRPVCGSVRWPTRTATDPFLLAQAPSYPASTEEKVTQYGPNETASLTPGIYEGGLKIQGTASLAPGTYVIRGGPLDITSQAEVTGSGVTFVIEDDYGATINGDSASNLTAPDGSFLIYAKQSTKTILVNGTSGARFDGVFYAPKGHVDVRGTNTTDPACWQIVAWQIEFSGNSGVSIDCEGRFDNVRAVRVIRLVE